LGRTFYFYTMAVNTKAYLEIKKQLDEKGVTLVAVSKIQPVEAILELYNLGQRDFGENYVQELVDKEARLPKDIRWHFIGHLQSNKVKYIAPFVHLIHGVDSYKLLKEIEKQGSKANRVINALLQMHIAQEETKFGLDETELQQILNDVAATPLPHVSLQGLMGMASFSEDEKQLKAEFQALKKAFDQCKNLSFPFQTLSMGMSGDYKLAIDAGSNMVRIGSLLFGARL
jgi:PLP dependent protein